MPKYYVSTKEIHIRTTLVEAEDKDDAKIEAENDTGELIETHFSHVAGPEHTVVQTESEWAE